MNYSISVTLEGTRCTAVFNDTENNVTSGGMGELTASFTIDSTWSGMNLTAVWYCGSTVSAVVLGSNLTCTVPADIQSNKNAMISVGVIGIKGDIKRTSTLANVTRIVQGAYISSTESVTHQDLYQQLIEYIDSKTDVDTLITDYLDEHPDRVSYDDTDINNKVDTHISDMTAHGVANKLGYIGSYDAAIAYSKNDVVIYDGGTWVATGSVSGSAPTDNNSNWIKIAVVSSSSTVVVDELPAIGDEEIDYIVKSGTGYLYYKYINNNWEMIAGSMAIVGNSLPDASTGNEFTDYYIADGAEYTHYRFIDGKYEKVGLDTYTKAEVDNLIESINEGANVIALQTAVSELQEKSSSQASAIESMETTQTSQGDDIAALKTTTESHTTDITKLKNDTENAVTNAETAKSSAESSSSAVSTLNTTVSMLQNDVAKNTTNIESNTSSITSLASTVAQNTQDIADVEVYTYRNEITMDDNGNYILSLYQTYESQETEVSRITLPATGGSGGSSSTSIMKIERITSSPLVVTTSATPVIEFTFSSVDSDNETVDSTYTLTQGTTLISSGNLIQGENSIDVSDYCSIGSQKFTLTCTDINGSTMTKTWTVQVVDVRLETSFSDKYTNASGSTVNFTYTPYGAVSKVVHFKLDGVEIGTNTTTSSGVLQQFTIPAHTHGTHLLEVYITATVSSTNIETEHIYKDVIWYDTSSTTPLIGCVYRNDYYGNVYAQQYSALTINYSVYDPETASPTVKLYTDGELTSTLKISQSYNTWTYKASTTGTHVLKIETGETVVTINVIVTDIGIEISSITAGLKFDFNPVGYSNSSTSRLWVDSTNTEVHMTVSDNFDWTNGGYNIDDDGDQYFMVKAGTRAYINYDLFGGTESSNIANTGMEFKTVFMVENVQDTSTTWMSCMNDNVGVQMNAHDGYLLTGASDMDKSDTYLYMPYCEEDIIELEININTLDRDNSDATSYVMSYEDGVGLKAMIYDSGHRMYQYTPVPITIGSDACDVRIYRMKAYSNALTDSNILTNFIADARNGEEMLSRYNRNQIYDENNSLTPDSVAEACPQLKVIKLEAPYFTNDKKDFVKGTKVECIHKGGRAKEDNWVITNAYHSGQGTTSNEYGYAGRNLDIIFNCNGVDNPNDKIVADPAYVSAIRYGDGTSIDDGTGTISLTSTSIPVNWLNIKVNIASSENANNALLQKRYNDFLTYTSLAQQRDSRIKNDMEFVNCVIFIRETNSDVTTHREFLDTDWHFYAIGNIGDSKKTDYTRAYDQTDQNEFTLEISDNTLNNSTFQSGVYMSGTKRTVESEKDNSAHSYVYPISASEWNASNKRYITLYADSFDGDSTFPVYDDNGNVTYNSDGEQQFASGSFEMRYGCKGDFKDGKLVPRSTDRDAENKAQLKKNADVWRAFYRWVITSTDSEFVAELPEWCVKDSVLYWYLFTHQFTMIDNRAKNTFWHFARTGEFRAVTKPVAELLHVYCEKSDDTYTITSDTSITSGKTYYTEYAFDLWDYDNDTAIGINNTGELTMSYGKEDVDYKIDGDKTSGWLFNAADSVIWCRTRDLLSSDLSNMYKNISSLCWSSSNIISEFDNWQSMFPEELWRLDIERKYIRTYNGGGLNGGSTASPTPRFLKSMMQGRKKYQRRQFLRNQEYYFGTKYLTSNITSDQIMFRCNTPTGDDIAVSPNYTLSIVPYSDMYLSVLFGNSSSASQVRAKAGQTYTINCPFSTMDDTAVLIYCASKIQSLNDLSACYIHDNDFSKAVKLKTLVIGSNISGYSNTFITNLVMGDNTLLEELDIRNCPNLGGSLNLAKCVNLKELYAEGTSIASITFAANAKTQTAHLPATIKTLVMRYLTSMSDLTAESWDNMESLTIYGGAVDTLGLVNETIDTIKTLNLSDINWELTETTLLNKIAALNSSSMSGMITLTGSIRTQEIETYNDKWPDLTLVYDSSKVVSQYLVQYVNYDGETVLYSYYEDRGSTPIDPVATGNIPAPTRVPDVKYRYTYSGWSTNINDILLANTTITAQYSLTPQTYTVTWYDAQNNVLQTSSVDYGSEAVYTGDIPTNASEESYKIYQLFNGWDKSTGRVTSNMSVYPTWQSAPMPSVGDKELNEMTPAEIYSIVRNGKHTEYFTVKDYFNLELGQDYEFSNVESKVLATDQNLVGTDYIDTGIKLFSKDSPSFTLLLDYKFYGYPDAIASADNTATNYCNSFTLASCFDAATNAGFRISYDNFWRVANATTRDPYPYSNNDYVKCSTTNYSGNFRYERLIFGNSAFRLTSYTGVRNQIVIRHVAGSDTINFYIFNPTNNLVYYYSSSYSGVSMTCANNREIDSTLILGALSSLSSVGSSGTACRIYHAKIWFDDLGDSVAKTLARGLHETIKMQYYAADAYTLYDNSGTTSMSFIANNALNNVYNYCYSGDGTSYTSQSATTGYGWSLTTLHDILNGEFYDCSIPIVWQSMIKSCAIKSYFENGQNVRRSSDKIYLPSFTEIINANSFTDESNVHPSWLLTLSSSYFNMFANYYEVTDESDVSTYTSSSDPTSVAIYGDSAATDIKNFDMWITNSFCRFYVDADMIEKYQLNTSFNTSTPGYIIGSRLTTCIMAANGVGGWVSATVNSYSDYGDVIWTRSNNNTSGGSNNHQYYFKYLYYGNSTQYTYTTPSYCTIHPCFSI